MAEPHMVVGQWYNLDPPANIHGKRFPKVFCQHDVPNRPNEYAVKGVPIGGDKEEPFILQFRTDRGLKVTPSMPPKSKPELKLV